MQHDRPAEETFTIEEVAQLLRVSERTVRRELDAGRLRFIRIRRSIRIPSTAYAQFVKDLSRKHQV